MDRVADNVAPRVSSNYAESTRRRLSKKQAETVDRLTRAGIEVLREREFSGLTIREVASRAGVGPATAYTYFSSKEHLVAEIFWRRLQAEPAPIDAGLDRTARVLKVLRSIALLVAGEPEVSGAVTNALLGTDPDVEHLRGRIGREIRQRLAGALGPDADEDVLETLEMIYAGALLRAGMGYDSYANIAEKLEVSARMILE
ncbi:TetR/AcrR family transcriptional regulator [Antrihabitans cavernicola]|uniref:TetR/AcrR family transcriptional regulator n=1 Tax=Antrihabitans cavernicola TaxID=2495913 RepID=A0A5A7SC40_9NOCA|nr:TetR/AcrR family transcriptional regulator [Spelaeibacter cavernicola]KAA0022909.1 TetR/AcrR family transcriptional regulator [Spelaeibacter cavernicola]